MLAGFNNITFEFGSRTIVKNITWHIRGGERIGLIGYNGTGKSTLLKLLMGEYQPSSGTVEKARDTSIGFLHQDLLSFDTSDSILEVALEAFEKVKQLEKQIETLSKKLETSSNEKLLTDYTDKLHELEILDGYNIHYKAEEVLHGLGFSNDDLQKPYATFSGGWRMRVLLAKMILQQPEILLLDEPTNHLDLPSIEWLEKYLQNYKGSVVIVSHDKYFLNRMVTKIVEIYQQQVHFYTGNYDFYEEEKMQRIELMQKAYDNQQDYIRQQERFIERFRAKASKAAAAQSLIKKLDKLERIEQVEIERPNLKINFRIDKQPGKVLVNLKHLDKKFGNITVLENAEAEIERGDKIALIGANGKGKSTLLRIIAGTESYQGERIWGHNIDESFYAQHQLEGLNLNNTLLEELQICRSGKTELELRTLLGCFLFSGDDADKKIKTLSGGEKARVALAKVIISKANFLLLDEPTNHLDIHSVELLTEALNKYEGTYILVSHDRYFISKTANKIWEIVDNKIKEFKGSYEEWVEWNERRKLAVGSQQLAVESSQSAVGSSQSGVTSRQPSEKNQQQKLKQEQKEQSEPTRNPAIVGAGKKRETQRDLQKLQKQFSKAEDELNELNTQKTLLEAALGSSETYSDKNKFLQTETDYNTVHQKIQKLTLQYEELFEKIMRIESMSAAS